MGVAGGMVTVFLMLSLTSLFADMAYEGGRSVLGPYIAVLGGSLLVAGAVSVGDLVAHGGRFLGGLAASRLGVRGLWGILFAGYTVNLVTVPMLALAGGWREAFALTVLERLGKGVRAAPRDVLLSEASRGMPRGAAFGLHELADQAGAVAGALLAGALVAWAGYRAAYAALGVPAALALATLYTAYRAYGRARRTGRPSAPEGVGPGRLPRWALMHAAAAGLGMTAFMHWVQASYRIAGGGASGAEVAALYSLAMLVDAAAAVPLGALYDRAPAAALALGPLASAVATLALLHGAPAPAAAALWGAAMACYEAPYRAHAALAPREARPLTYAAMYGAMGLGWTAGNTVMALLPAGEAALLAAAAGLAGAALAAAGARAASPARHDAGAA